MTESKLLSIRLHNAQTESEVIMPTYKTAYWRESSKISSLVTWNYYFSDSPQRGTRLEVQAAFIAGLINSTLIKAICLRAVKLLVT